MNARSRKGISGRATGKEAFKSNGEKRPRTRSPATEARTGNQVPTRTGSLKGGSSNHFPIVGIGASAGGLEAFTQLLQNLPVDTGMAFVLVQHLDPDHESALTQLLARTTSMPVTEVTQGTPVAANHIYVIPRNTCMELAKGVLNLRPRDKMPGAHRSIDVFF